MVVVTVKEMRNEERSRRSTSSHTEFKDAQDIVAMTLQIGSPLAKPNNRHLRTSIYYNACKWLTDDDS